MNHLIESQAYFQDDVTWCVQHARLRAEWKNFFYAADPNIYVFIFSAIPLIYVAYHFTAYERRTTDIWETILILSAIFSQQSTSYRPEKNSTRFFYVLFSVLSFFLISISMSFLIIRVTKINYEEQISSFEQITEENFCLAAEENTRNYLIQRNLVIDAFPFACLIYRIQLI